MGMVCDNISEKIFLGLDIDIELFKELENQSFRFDLPLAYVIENCLKVGLKEDMNMQTICLTEDVTEKVNIRCRQIDSTPEDLVNDIVYDELRKVEEILDPDNIDYERIWNMLDHDKPEGDDILDRITDMFD